MAIIIKKFVIEMEVKNKGIELGVYSPRKRFMGDFYVTKVGVEWCKGKTKQGNGVKKNWKMFAAMMIPPKKKKRKKRS